MQNRPSWQIDDCPGWCVVVHGEHDHPDDRVHRGSPVAVPVVQRRVRFDAAGIHRDVEPAEFDVALARVDGESETWLYAGAGPAIEIDVTAESAERLALAMREVLRNR